MIKPGIFAVRSRYAKSTQYAKVRIYRFLDKKRGELMSMMRELWLVNGTPWALEQWGVWSRQADQTLIRLWYPQASNFAGMRSAGVVSQLRIDDDTAMLIHDAISDLGEHKPEVREVLLSKYLFRATERAIAYRIELPRSQVRDLIHDGESWVDSRLFMHFRKRAA